MKRTGAFLMIVAFLIYCSASVFAASPAEILLEDFDRFADEKAAVEDFLQKTAEESASPDNVKTFSMEGAYRCLSAPVMDPCFMEHSLHPPKRSFRECSCGDHRRRNGSILSILFQRSPVPLP